LPYPTLWADDTVYERVAAAARERTKGRKRTWADVAAETRAIYAQVGVRSSSSGTTSAD
jgi:hypothetical protein